MAERINTAARNRQCDHAADDFNNGNLKMYTGGQPTSANDAPPGSVLADMTLPADAMNAAVNGVASKNGTWEDPSANGTGTPGWFRITSSDGLRRYDGAIGAGLEMEVSPTTITLGEPVTVTTFNLTQPAE